MVLLLASCKTAAPPPPLPTIPPEERAFLLDPTVSAPSVEPLLRAQIQSAYQSFGEGQSPAEVEAVAQKLLAAAPGAPPALLLLAQAEYLSGRYPAVVERLRPLMTLEPPYVAAALLSGRAEERRGDKLAAFEAYRLVADLDASAAAKASELGLEAFGLLSVEAQEAVDTGRFDEAEALLTRLENLAGLQSRQSGAKRVLELRLAIHRGRGQVREELAVLRQLRPLDDSRALRQRLGELEVEMGDVKAGLDLFEALLREFPSDPQLVMEIDRAKFRWRLERLPPRVRQIARKAELSRADLASLLYWLLPPVKHSPVVAPPIAGDILNHPAQQEILRVTDLDLMDVDETLHRFNPDSATSRRATLAALLALLSRQRVPCVAGEALAKDARSWVCRKSVECGLIGDESECQPATPISGTTAVDLMKACLDRLGDS